VPRTLKTSIPFRNPSSRRTGCQIEMFGLSECYTTHHSSLEHILITTYVIGIPRYDFEAM
jgi:ribosomal protein L32